MHVIITLEFNLDTHKRTYRDVVIVDKVAQQVTDSPLSKRLLLPTRLPQEWLPAELRTGASSPVTQWTDRSFVFQDGPEGLSGALPSHEARPVIDETFRPSEQER